VPPVAQVATKVDAVNQRAASAVTGAQAAASTAADAKASAAGVMVLAIIAIIVAVLLSAGNLVIGLRRRGR
jgi:hypothetical protein